MLLVLHFPHVYMRERRNSPVSPFPAAMQSAVEGVRNKEM
jgi:hypothetical protein